MRATRLLLPVRPKPLGGTYACAEGRFACAAIVDGAARQSVAASTSQRSTVRCVRFDRGDAATMIVRRMIVIPQGFSLFGKEDGTYGSATPCRMSESARAWTRRQFIPGGDQRLSLSEPQCPNPVPSME